MGNPTKNQASVSDSGAGGSVSDSGAGGRDRKMGFTGRPVILDQSVSSRFSERWNWTWGLISGLPIGVHRLAHTKGCFNL